MFTYTNKLLNGPWHTISLSANDFPNSFWISRARAFPEPFSGGTSEAFSCRDTSCPTPLGHRNQRSSQVCFIYQYRCGFWDSLKQGITMANRSTEPDWSLIEPGLLTFLASSTRLFRRPGPSVSPSSLSQIPSGLSIKQNSTFSRSLTRESFVRLFWKTDHSVTAGTHSQLCTISFLTKAHISPSLLPLLQKYS